MSIEQWPAVLLVLWCLLFAKQLVGRVDVLRKSSRDSLDEWDERHRIAISTTINSNQPLSSKNNAQIRDNSTQARLLSTAWRPGSNTREEEAVVKGFPIVLIAPDFNLLITWAHLDDSITFRSTCNLQFQHFKGLWARTAFLVKTPSSLVPAGADLWDQDLRSVCRDFTFSKYLRIIYFIFAFSGECIVMLFLK